MQRSPSSLIFTLGTLLICPVLSADEIHSHAPIVVKSRPVIERVPVKVIKPVDVAVNSLGDTLIADQIGKVLFRVDNDGEATLLGDDLEGICRVVDSPQLGIHILVAHGGTGRIIGFTDNGFQMALAYLPFVPVGLAVDGSGNLLTANNMRREIIRIDGEGKREVLVQLSEMVRDLVVDQIGNVVVLLESGKVVSVFGNSISKSVGFVSPSATRLALYPQDGNVIALTQDAFGKSTLVRKTNHRDEVDLFASVPRGTNAFAFDSLGNLTLACPDLRAITRVNSHFQVRCPHCEQDVTMILSPDGPPSDGPVKRRSF